MKNNAFIDILLNWEKMSQSKKMQRLQDLENMIARFQGRKPRTIAIKYSSKFVADNIGSFRDPEAFYLRSDSGKLYFFKFNLSAIDAIKNIIHEGFHAYVDDFVSGRVSTLKLYSKIDKERFFIEEENLPAIHEAFEEGEKMLIYDSMYIEEKTNYYENSLYITKMIIDAIENPFDAVRLEKDFIQGLSYGMDNERRGHKFERKYGVTYEDVVVQALNRDDIEKEQVVKTGKILDQIEPEYLEFFNRISKVYKEFVSVSDNPLMNPGAKKQAETELA
ncbi:MAG: hypothetical protein IKD36_00005, partial [Clostridia bacterium]|nr:hypothetical protein [Clostridia bacterium]